MEWPCRAGAALRDLQAAAIALRRARELYASARHADAATVLRKALQGQPRHARLLAARVEAEQGAALARAEAERIASRHAAELLAMLKVHFDTSPQ